MIISANTMEDNIAYIGLGSNIGDRFENLTSALRELSEFSTILTKSQIYETEPVGYKDQQDFLNMVVKISTNLSPIDLIIRLEEIEHKMGRIKEIIDGPRNIDLDILFFGNEIINSQSLKIPHPRLQNRKFVLQPLSEIAGELIHPVLNKSIQALAAALKSTEKVTLWTSKN